MNHQTIINALLFGWQTNGDYGRKLLSDIPNDKLTAQPLPGMNHPAWLIAHLNFYHPAILSLARGEAITDPGHQPQADLFDEGSVPSNDPMRYPSKASLLETFERNHQQIAEAVKHVTPQILAAPPGLDRWHSFFPTTADGLVYLMAQHEGVHLGQLSAWRRAMGLPPVD